MIKQVTVFLLLYGLGLQSVDQEFTNLQEKESGRILRIVPYVIFGPSFDVPGEEKVKKEINPHAEFVQCLKAVKDSYIVLRQFEDGSTMACGRKAMIDMLIQNEKEKEQKFISDLGKRLKKGQLAFFGSSAEGQDFSFEMKLGESFAFTNPAMFIAADVKDGRVSYKELGYVASQMLAEEKSKEIRTDRYTIKQTFFDKDSNGVAIDLSDLMPKE